MKPLRLVVWNCGGGLHAKEWRLRSLDADIAVLVECSERDAAALADMYAGGSSRWVGECAGRGLAVVARVPVSHSERTTRGMAHTMTLDVGGAFSLLAVWTFDPPGGRYAAKLHAMLDERSAEFASGPWVVAGDLNSNARFDRPSSLGHAALVERLGALGLVSAYHAATGEAQGAETRATYLHRRNSAQPHHLDHVFVPAAWAPKLEVSIGTGPWSEASDHLPVVVDIGRTTELTRPSFLPVPPPRRTG